MNRSHRWYEDGVFVVVYRMIVLVGLVHVSCSSYPSRIGDVNNIPLCNICRGASVYLSTRDGKHILQSTEVILFLS